MAIGQPHRRPSPVTKTDKIPQETPNEYPISSIEMKRTFQSLSGLPSSPRLSEYTEMPSKARKNNHNVDWTSQNEDYADGESDQISLKKRHIAHNLDPARPILEYDGYLKHTVNVRLSDYQLLQGEHELNDVILDMLISHAYAQAFEDSPDAVSEALVFPTSFFIQLKAKTRPESTQQSQFEKAHSIVSHYDRFVWRSSVILIPAQVDRRWVLLVVCNAGEAKSSQHVLPPRQFIEAGDRKPDNRRFCILSLDPEGRSQSKLRSLTREYLKYDYMRMTGNELEFVEDFEARCPYQLDPASSGLHVVRYVEALLFPGGATAVRKHAQGVVPKSRTPAPILFNDHQLIDAYRESKRKVVEQEADMWQHLHGNS